MSAGARTRRGRRRQSLLASAQQQQLCRRAQRAQGQRDRAPPPPRSARDDIDAAARNRPRRRASQRAPPAATTHALLFQAIGRSWQRPSRACRTRLRPVPARHGGMHPLPVTRAPPRAAPCPSAPPSGARQTCGRRASECARAAVSPTPTRASGCSPRSGRAGVLACSPGLSPLPLAGSGACATGTASCSASPACCSRGKTNAPRRQPTAAAGGCGRQAGARGRTGSAARNTHLLLLLSSAEGPHHGDASLASGAVVNGGVRNEVVEELRRRERQSCGVARGPRVSHDGRRAWLHGEGACGRRAGSWARRSGAGGRGARAAKGEGASLARSCCVPWRPAVGMRCAPACGVACCEKDGCWAP